MGFLLSPDSLAEIFDPCFANQIDLESLSPSFIIIFCSFFLFKILIVAACVCFLL